VTLGPRASRPTHVPPRAPEARPQRAPGTGRTEFRMSAPWSGYEPVVTHTFNITNEATRSDFLNICYANEIDDNVIDGFDALREGVMYKSVDEVKAALKTIGQLDE
jgi:hypothetical protein